MRLLVINPNTTASMTEKIAQPRAPRRPPGTEIVATNPRPGPASIEGYYDEALCVPGVLEIVRKAQGVDGVVIACFDDTGLDAVRCLTAAPVIGIGEAGFHFAAMLSNKFSVVTTLARSVPAIEHNLVRYGLATRCARVRRFGHTCSRSREGRSGGAGADSGRDPVGDRWRMVPRRSF